MIKAAICAFFLIGGQVHCVALRHGGAANLSWLPWHGSPLYFQNKRGEVPIRVRPKAIANPTNNINAVGSVTAYRDFERTLFDRGLQVVNIGLSGFLLIYIVILLLLGCIIDAASTMLIAGPLAIPVAQMFGADPIWFGIVTVIGAEVGLLTPPFGMSVYAVKATLADDSVGLADIFAGAFPFVLMMLLVLFLVCLFPWFALVLVK